MMNAARKIQSINKSEPTCLSEYEINQFIEDGFIIVRQLFSSEYADMISSMVLEEAGINKHNLSERKQPHNILKKILNSDPIPQIFTQQYKMIVNELCGLGRWEMSDGLGYWFITLPGFNQTVWSPYQKEWHLDGNSNYFFLNKYKLGLITFHLITSVAKGGGGTSIRIGSHKFTARILAEAGLGGISYDELSRKAADATKDLPYIEATGQSGDVMFMHPLTVHTRSLNTSGQVRIAGHKFFHLFEALNINRKYQQEYSPVEASIFKALSEQVK